ncbi:MAG: DHH family phosphoesterase [Lachnospiraceae bacterium]|nr:DHH family phosphoesterase [Lachnospiraceae bacterium]
MKIKMRLKGRLRTYLRFTIYLGALLCAIDVAAFFLNKTAAIMLIGFTIIYFAVTLILYFVNKPLIMNELVSFATEYGQIQKRLLRELELPYALLDEEGRVMWTNKAFENTVHQPKGYNKSITTLFPTITLDRLPDGDTIEETECELEYENRDYTAKFRKISLKEMADHSNIIDAKGYDGYLIACFLFDETALHIALQEVDDQSLCVGMIYLDNYDEAMESVEEVRQSLLVAVLDRKVNKYVASVDGICKKLEKDKFLVILRKKAAIQLQEEKFELLDEIKHVSIGNEMAVTASIGLGIDGLSYAQDYEFARNAIDLALGRGGDQAVIKTPSGVTYYGGKSQQVEKNTRVKARVKAHALREIISAKESVLIMGHSRPDADSFGSTVGIYCMARELQRKAYIVLEGMNNDVQALVDCFKAIPGNDDVIINHQQAIDMAGSNTALVVVDVNKPSITECPELIHLAKTVVVLDHHRAGSEVIENATLSYVEPFASSVCEMISEILQYVQDNVKIRGEEADCMYAGIMVDTNNFLSKTGVRTFEAAAFLRRCGADVTRVRKMFRSAAEEYKAKADAVSQAEIYRNSYAISVCTSEDIPYPPVVGAQAANELLNIMGIRASFVLTEYQGKIYVSARSIDEVNVQLIMERMGGGGHMNIAACQLEGVSLIVAIGEVKRTIDAMIDSGEL